MNLQVKPLKETVPVGRGSGPGDRLLVGAVANPQKGQVYLEVHG